MSVFFVIFNYLKWEIEKIYFLLFQKIFLTKESNNSIFYDNIENFDIYVIAFNNFDLIELVIEEYYSKFQFNFNLFIFDNSSINNNRKKIHNICKKNKINYISIPLHPTWICNSKSHALAINWIFNQFIGRRNVLHYAFIDHDILPLTNIHFNDLFSTNEVLGIKHCAVMPNSELNIFSDKAKYYYLWPGFLFFSNNQLKTFRKINFMPFSYNGYQFDTGGKTFFYMNNLLRSKIKYSLCKRVLSSTGYHVDFIDEKWLHTLSGSNWRNLPLGESYEMNLLKYYRSER